MENPKIRFKGFTKDGNSVSLVTLPQENRSQENHPTIYQA